MADTDNRETAGAADGAEATPMTDADTTPPPADAAFQPAAPLKEAGVEFEPDTADVQPTAAGTATPTQAIKDGAAKLRAQTQDKARVYAEDGKTKATNALGQFSQLLNDAAEQVDERLGEQYGQYARTAAERVQAFSSSIEAKDVDELIEDARAFVRKSPAVAIGIAAGVGFVVARVLSAGLDQRDA